MANLPGSRVKVWGQKTERVKENDEECNSQKTFLLVRCVFFLRSTHTDTPGIRTAHSAILCWIWVAFEMFAKATKDFCLKNIAVPTKRQPDRKLSERLWNCGAMNLYVLWIIPWCSWRGNVAQCVRHSCALPVSLPQTGLLANCGLIGQSLDPIKHS